jgi:hypothetical protein
MYSTVQYMEALGYQLKSFQSFLPFNLPMATASSPARMAGRGASCLLLEEEEGEVAVKEW